MDIKNLSNSFLRISTQIHGSNICNITFSKFSKTVILACIGMPSTFTSSIQSIGRVVAKKKMLRITAKRIVASMTNQLVTRIGSIRKRPSDPMGSKLMVVKLYPAISPFVSSMFPVPTLFRFSNVYHIPKSIYLFFIELRYWCGHNIFLVRHIMPYQNRSVNVTIYQCA